MPDGAPPPWLINMERYGPPPSYPHLKIPELNAPLKHKRWGDLEEEKKNKLRKMKSWRMEFSLLIPFLALLLAMRHLKMLLTFERERNLRGLYTKSLRKNKRGLLQGLYLEQHTPMSLFSQKSWKLWIMFFLQNTSKQRGKPSYVASLKISVTWL
ncbi:hypothetical protein Ddye_022376 [Dipteronia dyeriana]|uniref:PSP proline-rich domain-containing protein n=1 Tax=Dipteronia dyeriana TaxID=168575 RepID=A0AAD9U439_9ROSI|nr:hypothetical protein Ddye_022376 [Dipteronia dyeriana]